MANHPPEPPYENHPISREEYEERHAELEARYGKFAQRSTRILAAIFVMFAIVGGTSAYLAQQNNERAAESAKNAHTSVQLSHRLIHNAIQSCRFNGNPLRATVRKFGKVLVTQKIQEQTRTEAFVASGFYEEVFPGLSPDRLKTLITEQAERTKDEVAAIRAATAAIDGVDCKAIYDPTSPTAEARAPHRRTP